MRRAVATITTALSLLAGQCKEDTTPPPPPPPVSCPTTLAEPVGAEAYVFGDSLTAWAAVGMDWGGPVVSVNARANTQINCWTPLMATVPAGATIVIALGTRDVIDDLMAVTRADVDAALAATAHAGCVVWVTPSQHSADLRGWPYDVRTTDLRAHLAASGVNIVDWSATADGHDEYLTPDEIHHTDAGNRAYQDAERSAVNTCAAR
jgi:hypothetical protein